MKNLYNAPNKPLTLWLIIMCLAVICMIGIGGYTRLTHSGLSITQWQPVTGIVPPLSEELWEQEFHNYQQSPEYLKINSHISLAEFKSIFWVEFIHRLAGRITGILYLIPLIFFVINRTIRGKDILIYLGGFILLTGQGFAGWYMVKSGLVSAPHVSHFRLAIHLLLAVFLYALLFWQLLTTSWRGVRKLDVAIQTNKHHPSWRATENTNKWLNVSLILLFIQIIFGAFVAGLNAGLIYNSFPLMGDALIPHEINWTTLTIASFSDPVFIQFMHRMIAYIVMITILYSCYIGFKINNSLSKALICIICALVFQITAGIITLIYSVPLTIALLHQLGAVILLSTILWAKYLVVSKKN
jgi:cytochrome c oxidase assembly protein subunit 15